MPIYLINYSIFEHDDTDHQFGETGYWEGYTTTTYSITELAGVLEVFAKNPNIAVEVILVRNDNDKESN